VRIPGERTSGDASAHPNVARADSAAAAESRASALGRLPRFLTLCAALEMSWSSRALLKPGDPVQDGTPTAAMTAAFTGDLERPRGIAIKRRSVEIARDREARSFYFPRHAMATRPNELACGKSAAHGGGA